MTVDLLRGDYSIDTPENVTFGYELAGIGTRFIAALIDTTIIGLAAILANVLVGLILSNLGDAGPFGILAEHPDWATGVVLAIYALVDFVLIWGYFVLFELLWNGQTPGKSRVHARVVSTDGSPAGFLAIAVRNLLRLIDFMPVGYAVGLVTMFCNSQARRLGDYAAGTVVVKERRDVALAQLVRDVAPAKSGVYAPTAGFAPITPAPALPTNGTTSAKDGPAPSTAAPEASAASASAGTDASAGDAGALFIDARLLTLTEYNLIADVLDRDARRRLDDTLVYRLAEIIAPRLGLPVPLGARRSREFLAAVAVAYQSAR